MASITVLNELSGETNQSIMEIDVYAPQYEIGLFVLWMF